jgi:hypothetical protein
MTSPAIILVTDAIPMDAEERGEGAHEHLQEHRARTNLGHGDGNGSWPTVTHLWEGTDLCRLGMRYPSLDVQPDDSLLDTRSPASLNATSQALQSAPTLAILRRLTIRATPLSGRNVGGRVPAGGKGATCERPRLLT